MDPQNTNADPSRDDSVADSPGEEPPCSRPEPATCVQLEVYYHVDGLQNDTERFEAAARCVAEKFALKSLTASVSIVDDPAIHEVNREHLDHDWPTDVISFVFESVDGVVDGEIVASSDTAARCAEAAGWPRENELLLYVLHGLLHLSGLDDLDEPSALEMRLAEQDCLRRMGIEGAEEHLSRWDDVSYES